MKRILLLMALILIAGCRSLTAPPPTRTMEEKSGDTAIVLSIQEGIRADCNLRVIAGAIHVRSFDGHVVLSGAVPDPLEAAKLVDIASSTPGVMRVTNDLLVSTLGGPPGA